MFKGKKMTKKCNDLITELPTEGGGCCVCVTA
jgi:hypothetical protein